MALRAPSLLLRESLLGPLQEALLLDRNATRPIASGLRVEMPSDDPLDYVRARGLEAEIRSSKQFVQNAQDAMRLLEYADARVGEITDRLQRARVLALQGANDTLSTADKAMLAAEVNLIIDDLVEVGNARADGVAIFAGAETDEDPFRVVRDADGKVQDVIYRGDRVESVRKIGVAETDREIVTLVGSLIFQVYPDSMGSGFSSADPSAPLAGLLPAGATDVAIEVNGRRIVLDLATDGLLDVAEKINDSIAGVTASVTGALVGTTPQAAADAAIAGVTAGDVVLNGETLTVAAGETLDSLAGKINALSGRTGVTASVVGAAGAYSLRLDGGIEIDDVAAGASNVFRAGRTGVTSGGAPPGNLLGVVSNYRLRLETDVPDQLFLRDLSDGRFLQRMELIDGVETPTGNAHANAIVDDVTMFSLLRDLRDALEGGATEEGLREYLTSLEEALDSNINVRATIGARRTRVEKAQVREEAFQVELKRFLSEAQDADIAAATTDLALARARLQAAAEAAKGVAPVTLSQFL